MVRQTIHFVSLNFNSRNVVGTAINGEPSRQIEHIAPGDSETVTFNLTSLVSGQITAATLDSDGNVAGRFELKTSVGELGIPLSPDSLAFFGCSQFAADARPRSAAIQDHD